MSKVLFVGSKSIGLTCLKAIHFLMPNSLSGVITIDDRSDSRSCYSDFLGYCAENGITLHKVSKRSEFRKVVLDVKPNFCLVVGWYWIVEKSLLNKVSFIGIHNSLLPKYRGGSPLVWAMINGDKLVGTTLFSFTEGMDDGVIWNQKCVKVDDRDYVSDILERIEQKAITMLTESYERILNGSLQFTEQDHSKATYCSQRFPKDGLIYWSKSAVVVYNFIRAQSWPYPGAFTFDKRGEFGKILI